MEGNTCDPSGCGGSGVLIADKAERANAGCRRSKEGGVLRTARWFKELLVEVSI